jgi:hypothetical protein
VANNDDADPVSAPPNGGPRGRALVPRRPRVVPDPAATPVVVGQPVQAVVRVRLDPAASRRGFERYVRTLAGVRCAWQVTGDVHYELLVTCPAVADLDDLLACLRGCGGTEVTSAGLVLRELRGPAAGRARPRVPAARDGGSR